MFHLIYLHTTARKHGWTTNWFLCWFLLILLSTLQSATCYTNFIFSSSLPDILRRGECRSISTSYCLGVMAFYPLVTDPDNNSDIYLSGWTLVCTRHIRLSCIIRLNFSMYTSHPIILYFPTTVILLESCIDHELLAHDLGFNCQGESSKGSQIFPIVYSANHRRH